MNLNATKNNQYIIFKDTIQNIIEKCREIYLKFKIYENNSYDFLNLISTYLNEISNELMKHEDIFYNEFKFYCQIEKYVIYIVGKNCNDNNFGFLDYVEKAIFLFKDLFDKKIEFLTKNISNEEYESQLEKSSEELNRFTLYFNLHIFKKDSQFKNDIEILNKMIRSD